MSPYSTLLPICLLGIACLVNPPEVLSQAATQPDTASVAADTHTTTDSQRGATDSVPKTDTARVGPDAVPRRSDSVSRSDSVKGYSDSAPSPVTSAPADSILSAACNGDAGLAPDLLIIVFSPDAGAADRAAVARSVGGKLLGQVGSGEPEAYYLRVPSGRNEFRLRLASDELIQRPEVRQVGSRSCPSPPATSGQPRK